MPTKYKNRAELLEENKNLKHQMKEMRVQIRLASEEIKASDKDVKVLKKKLHTKFKLGNVKDMM